MPKKQTIIKKYYYLYNKNNKLRKLEKDFELRLKLD